MSSSTMLARCRTRPLIAPAADWDRMIDVNIKVLYGIAAVLPHMRSQRAGTLSMYRPLPGIRCGQISSSIRRLRQRCG